MRGTAWCDASAIHAIPGAWWWAWALAVAAGLLRVLAAPSASASRAWRGVAVALFTFPAWRVVLDVAPLLAKTFCEQGNVAAALPGPPALGPGPYEFSGQYLRTILDTLGPIALGALAHLQAVRPGGWRRPTVPAMARGLRGLVPMGRGDGREGRSMAAGVALFPLLALANLALLALAGEPVLTAQRDPYYARMGAFHAVALAAAAAVAEEVLYRGVMQHGLWRLVRARLPALPPAGAAALAIAPVSLAFAYAHGGYGNPTLLLFAVLFSALAGVVALRWGLWAAIALHALIDFYAFARDAAAWDAAMGATVGVVTAAVLAVAGWRAWVGSREQRKRAGVKERSRF